MSQYNIVDFGAVGDGKTLCTAAIQRAIDLCPAGGTVKIPAGRFVSVSRKAYAANRHAPSADADG